MFGTDETKSMKAGLKRFAVAKKQLVTDHNIDMDSSEIKVVIGIGIRGEADWAISALKKIKTVLLGHKIHVSVLQAGRDCRVKFVCSLVSKWESVNITTKVIVWSFTIHDIRLPQQPAFNSMSRAELEKLFLSSTE